MKFHLLIILFGFFVSSKANCANPLLTSLEVTGESTESTKSGLNHCKSFKDKPTCCSADVINNINSRTKSIKSQVRDIVIARDRYLYDTLKELTPEYTTQNARFKTSSKNAFDKLEQMNSNQILSLYTTVNLISAKALAFESAASSLKDTFSKYQKSRTTCVTRMLKLQGAAFCLACDPEWATKGVSSTGTIQMASKVCSRIKRACYDFIIQAKDKSLIAEAKILLSVYQDLIDRLDQIANQGTIPSSGFNYVSDFLPSEVSKKAITLPSTCLNDVSCDYLCTNLLKNGKLDKELMGVGAGPFASNDLYDNNFFQRILEENSTNATALEAPERSMMLRHEPRMLQTGEWAPDDDEAGIDASFEDDPAEIFKYGQNIMPFTALALFAYLMSLFA